MTKPKPTKPITPSEPSEPAKQSKVDEGTSYAVICHTCHANVWQGNELITEDGQELLTSFADSTPGSSCPSKVGNCPYKAAAIEERKQKRPATLADLEALNRRLVALETRTPRP